MQIVSRGNGRGHDNEWFRNGNKLYNVGDRPLPIERFRLKRKLVGDMLRSSTTLRQRSRQELLTTLEYISLGPMGSSTSKDYIMHRICVELFGYSESRDIIFSKEQKAREGGRRVEGVVERQET